MRQIGGKAMSMLHKSRKYTKGYEIYSLKIDTLDVAENGEVYALEVERDHSLSYINKLLTDLGFEDEHKSKKTSWVRSYSDKSEIDIFVESCALTPVGVDRYSLCFFGKHFRRSGRYKIYEDKIIFSDEGELSVLGEEIIDRIRDYLDWVNLQIEEDNLLLNGVIIE